MNLGDKPIRTYKPGQKQDGSFLSQLPRRALFRNKIARMEKLFKLRSPQLLLENGDEEPLSSGFYSEDVIDPIVEEVE